MVAPARATIRCASSFSYKHVDPNLRVIAPWREWEIKGRKDEIEYARERNIPITATLEKIYSHDRNMWHLSSEGGELEDPWNEPPEHVYELTKSPEAAPDKPTYIELGFEAGHPCHARWAGDRPRRARVQTERDRRRERHRAHRPRGKPPRRHEEPGRLRNPRRYDPRCGAP